MMMERDDQTYDLALAQRLQRTRIEHAVRFDPSAPRLLYPVREQFEVVRRVSVAGNHELAPGLPGRGFSGNR